MFESLLRKVMFLMLAPYLLNLFIKFSVKSYVEDFNINFELVLFSSILHHSSIVSSDILMKLLKEPNVKYLFFIQGN